MIPFLSEKRPQDDVSFGPDFPAEDDFALNNLSLTSTLPGRLVLPDEWQRFRRFHDLQGLTAREMAKWRFAQWSFLYKMARLAGNRALLLKTPSHTARIPELLDLCGGFGNDDGGDRGERIVNGPKFIHIARDPESVIESNIRMLQRLSIYHLQDRPADEVLGERVVEEYVRTEERYLATRDSIPKGHLVEVRYDDLVARPCEVMRSVYDRLGFAWSDAFEMNLNAYLASVRDYKRAKSQPSGNRLSSGVHARYADRIEAIREALACGSLEQSAAGVASIVGAGRDEPREAMDRNQHGNTRAAKTVLTMVGMCMVCILLWLVIANVAHNRYDWLIWPTGIAVGYAGLRAAGAGTMRLGLIASVITLTALLVVSVPNTRTIYYRNHPDVSAADVWDTTTNELTAGPTILWALMGMVTAYRFASRSRIRPGSR